MGDSPVEGPDGAHARPGDRVVVRHRVEAATRSGPADPPDPPHPPGPRLTDVVGTLLETSPDALVVLPDRTPGAAPVVVPADRVVTVLPVPPRARPSARIDELERRMAEHWRAPDTARLGGDAGWLLRAAEGFTNRANSALVVGDPGVPAEEALSHVTAWYAHRGLPPRLAVPAWETRRWERLRAAGWHAVPGAGAHVCTADTAALLAGPLDPARPGVGRLREGARPLTDRSGLIRLRWSDEPDAAWLAGYHYRGGPTAPVARRLLLSAPEQVFGSVLDDAGATRAVVRVSGGAGLAGVTAVEVDPAYRRLGVATALVAAAAGWAAERAYERIFLQVGTGNRAARLTYLRAGFTLHHGYEYVAPPS